MKNKDSLYVLLLTACLGVLYVFLFSDLRWNEWDTPNFIHAAKILFGDTSQVDLQSRITKPFVLFFPGLLYYVFGTYITTVMFVQNCLFWLGTGLLFSKLIKEFGFNKQLQLLGVFILFTIQPIAVHAFELINDIAGYFFTIASLYFYCYFKNRNNLNLRFYICLIIILSLGFLSKETTGVAILYIIVDSFINKNKAVTNNLIAIIISFILVFFVQLYIKITFGYKDIATNVLDEFIMNNGYSFRIAQLFHSFDVYWIFIIIGLWKIKKDLLFVNKTLFTSILFITPFLFVWSTVQDRTIAIIAPLYILVMLYFIQQNSNNKWYLYFILVGGVLNILVTYIIYTHAVSNILEYYYGIYVFIFIIGMFIFNKKTIVE